MLSEHDKGSVRHYTSLITLHSYVMLQQGCIFRILNLLIKPMTRIILFIAAAFISLSSCKKKELSPMEQLPPITDTGAKTFGCLINGVPFKPLRLVMPSLASSLYCRYYKQDEILYFQLGASDFRNNAYFRFYMDSIHLGPGTRSFSGPGRGKLNVIYENYHTDKSVLVMSPVAPGEFKITKFDTSTGILAGTFWFDAIDTATNRKVEIREGRFDLYVKG